MIDLGRSCTRHRPALVDFVDRGEVRPETKAALAHLDRCERCTAAIESTVLTITAIRRYADSLDAAGPAPDAWPRLAARVTSWRRRPVSMSPLTGVAMRVAMVVAIVLPFRLGPGELGRASGSAGAGLSAINTEQPDAIRVADRASRRQTSTEDATSSIADDGSDLVGVRVIVLDDVVVTTKEVAQAKPIIRLGGRI